MGNAGTFYNVPMIYAAYSFMTFANPNQNLCGQECNLPHYGDHWRDN